MHQDDERRQHRDGGEEEQALRQREAGRGASARKRAGGGRERGGGRRGRASAAGKSAPSRDAALKRRRNRPNSNPAISHPLNALLGKSPTRAGYGVRIGGKWHNATEIGQGRTGLGRAAPSPAKSASALPEGHSRPVDRCGFPGGA